MTRVAQSVATSLAQSLAISISGANVLPFSRGTYANASERNLLARPSVTDPYEMTGPFAANVLATRVIGGNKYGLFEGEYINIFTYNRLLTHANWVKVRLETPTAYTDPLGGSEAWKLIPNSESEEVHRIYQTFTPDGSSSYLLYALAKAGEYDWINILFSTDGFPGTPSCFFDLTNGVIGTNTNCDDKGILQLEDGWYLCYIIATSDSATLTYSSIYVAEDDNDITFTGNSSDGLYVYNPQLVKADFFVNPIETGSSPVTKAPDVFYFPSANVPAWMKKKFTVKLIPNYDIPSQISADKALWSFSKPVQNLATSFVGYGMKANANYIYYANYSAGKIQRCDLDGSNVTDLFTGISGPSDVGINSTKIFWVAKLSNKIQSGNIDGSGSPVDEETGLTAPYGIDIDETNMYWSDPTDGKVYQRALGGGSVIDFVTGVSGVIGVCIDQEYSTLYFTQYAIGHIKSIPLAGGSVKTLVTGQTNTYFLTVNNAVVIWCANNAGKVRCINKNGSAVFDIADESGAFSVASYNGSIFWAGTTAAILRRLDSVTTWITTTGTVKVVDGPDTKVETSAATASMHDELEVEFDRESGKITLSGFATGDGEYTDESWSEPNANFEYGCALNGAAQTDGIVEEPKS